jgi:hypothetical protein
MLELIPITQLALPIPDAISDRAWQQAQADVSIETQWHIYLNQIATALLVEYLQEDFPNVRVGSPENTRPLVNGSILQLNGKRLVLVPSKAIDHSELVIPQEWIDIPDWAGDYFLAVQIDPDEQMLHCWGYTTHQMVKAKAQYDANDRTYNLAASNLVADVSGLWVIQQINPQEVTQSAVAPLAAVASTQAENLLQRLVAVRNPRLEIPFELWGGLVSDRNWRDRLVELRQGATSLRTDVITAVNQLSSWMQNVFASGWQAVEDFWGADAELAFAFRQAATASPPVRRVKALRFTDQLLLLLVSIEAEADGRMGIQVQLRSSERTEILPSGVTLALLSSDDEVMQSIATRDQDNAIQLPRFRSVPGTEFKIQVQLGATVFCESFMV